MPGFIDHRIPPFFSLFLYTFDQIRGLLPPELMKVDKITGKTSIWESSPPESDVPDLHYFNLLSRISYTHFVELIRIEEPLKRLFYELECLKGNWSVKELKRQVGSSLYERTGLSKNKETSVVGPFVAIFAGIGQGILL
jgi:hypothetical protein